MMKFNSLDRRKFIRQIPLLASPYWLRNERWTAFKSKYRLGACDWSIQNNSNLGAMEMAKLIGLDGVQVSLGLAENEMHLRRPEVLAAYKSLAKIFKVGFTGLAIGELNNIPFKSEARTDQWVSDSIDVAKALGVRVVLLAFFHKNDLKGDRIGTERVIQKLKEICPKAEKQNIILGIESWLSAEEHVYIIDQVQSSHLQVYYDVANSEKMGYDIYKEIVWLGKKNLICEFHFKENGYLLGQGRVDFTRVKKCMEEIDFTGNIQIEGAVPDGSTMLPSYIQNNQFVRQLLA
jgi:L-ribulose-5-phosphate 3-epimerase